MNPEQKGADLESLYNDAKRSAAKARGLLRYERSRTRLHLKARSDAKPFGQKDSPQDISAKIEVLSWTEGEELFKLRIAAVEAQAACDAASVRYHNWRDEYFSGRRG